MFLVSSLSNCFNWMICDKNKTKIDEKFLEEGGGEGKIMNISKESQNFKITTDELGEKISMEFVPNFTVINKQISRGTFNIFSKKQDKEIITIETFKGDNKQEKIEEEKKDNEDEEMGVLLLVRTVGENKNSAVGLLMNEKELEMADFDNQMGEELNIYQKNNKTKSFFQKIKKNKIGTFDENEKFNGDLEEQEEHERKNKKVEVEENIKKNKIKDELLKKCEENEKEKNIKNDKKIIKNKNEYKTNEENKETQNETDGKILEDNEEKKEKNFSENNNRGDNINKNNTSSINCEIVEINKNVNKIEKINNIKKGGDDKEKINKNTK